MVGSRRDGADVGDAGGGGAFEYIAGRLGVRRRRPRCRLPSEFDFATQAVLFLPPDMPDPRSPEFNARRRG